VLNQNLIRKSGSLVVKTSTGKTKTKTSVNKTANGDVKQNIAYRSRKHFLYVIILSAEY